MFQRPFKSRSRLRNMGGLAIESVRDRELHLITLTGELDLATVGQLAQELSRVEASDANGILLDLERLQFIDSIGMHAVIRLSARVDRQGKSLLIRRGPDNVHRSFELCGLTSRLHFVDAEWVPVK